jgi:hypothetical protein
VAACHAIRAPWRPGHELGAIAQAETHTHAPSRLPVGVRVQSFLLRAIGEHGVGRAAVNQRHVAEDADLRLEQREIFEGAGFGDVLEVLVTIAGDTRGLGSLVGTAPGLPRRIGTLA